MPVGGVTARSGILESNLLVLNLVKLCVKIPANTEISHRSLHPKETPCTDLQFHAQLCENKNMHLCSTKGLYTNIHIDTIHITKIICVQLQHKQSKIK